ncbi:MAG TPA: DoxX-like family protein, partial [Terriglobia bacterium]|nr:DoxX-like family protein [Terriglobia bacterium]
AAMLADAGWSAEIIPIAVRWAGIAEVAFGLLMLLAWRVRSLFAVTVVVMLAALAFVGMESPRFLSAAFNPVTLNLSMIALSLIGLISGRDLPSASRCLRKRGER